ncbi:pyridoxamine 5'-phosphate oxidase family protein [Rubrivivax sp. RP6-9]|uniref:2Fe-2S iron-sulfur cluster-binding protein n=1 Tax=Rubrivivax sp. RP6-9 TaxID=3415750 RepID=UPI003CC51AC9
MSQGYARIAFTPAVQALQQRHGSAAQYTLSDDAAAPDEGLGAREQAFIAARDTLVQATVSETGWPYVQHRGGPPGFIQVLDERTIAYPDFRGNQQYLSVGNLGQDDRISILFVDPAAQRRLKLFGRARLLDAQADPALFERLRLAHPAATVERVFVVQVAGHDWNCPQHIVARFTEQEVAAATAPLRARAERAERRVAEFERTAQPAAAGPRTLGRGAVALVVAGVRQLTPRVRAFELRHADGSPLPAFDAGAHLVLPVALPDGTAASRHYSIASDPRDRSRYEVAVLHTPGGGAAFAHAQWSLGTVLRADPPQNHFPLAGGTGPCLLVAGGIGITPLKAMALQLVHAGRACALHHAVRSVREAAYADELAALLGTRHVLHPSDAGRRLDIDRLLQRSDTAQLQVYVCGPPSLVAAVRTRALAAGVAPAHIHSERFAPPDGQAGDTAFALRLHRSGRVVHVLPGQTMLQALEQAGVPAAASCRVGICRTCAVPVLDGTPDHRDEVLTAAERSSGRLVCLCVSRAHTPVLTLDL